MIEPITYVILNHGRFGEELIKSAELIAGKTEHIHAVSLLSGMSIEEYYEEVRDYLTGVQGEILVLADLYGGTPSNVGMMLQREFSLHVVCGINLPMLIELILKRNNEECTIQELMEAGLEAARASIIQPNPINWRPRRAGKPCSTAAIPSPAQYCRPLPATFPTTARRAEPPENR